MWNLTCKCWQFINSHCHVDTSCYHSFISQVGAHFSRVVVWAHGVFSPYLPRVLKYWWAFLQDALIRLCSVVTHCFRSNLTYASESLSWIHQPNHSFHSRNRKLIIVTAEFSSQPVDGKYRRSFQLHTCVWLNMRKFIIIIIIISSSTIITIFRESSTIIAVSVYSAASNTKSK